MTKFKEFMKETKVEIVEGYEGKSVEDLAEILKQKQEELSKADDEGKIACEKEIGMIKSAIAKAKGGKSEDEKEEETNESTGLKIKLEDGEMKVTSKNQGSGASDEFVIDVSYEGTSCSFTSDDYYMAGDVKGDPATLLNMLIQQFFMDGTVKSK